MAPHVPALGATPPAAVEVRGGQSVDEFYAARDWRPLWLRADGSAGVEAMMLLDILRTADSDGLDADRYRVRNLGSLVRSARSGNPAAVRRAELALSNAFTAYVRDLRRAPDVGVIYVDGDLRPKAASPRALLDDVARARSVEEHLGAMGWMHPIYAGLRNALASGHLPRDQRALVRLNLERARLLPPAASKQKYVIVNAAAARLTMYEGDRIVDSMRVVVGKPHQPTPMMAAYIRYTSLNPYWNVPPDLAAERVAPNVVKAGLGYLRQMRYQVLSDWTENAKVIGPEKIDWQAVADGSEQVRLRQLPGPANSMGKMKFMFPNAQGIYLHDTPQKELLTEASRMFSGGCVRLEDAPRFARWLYGRPLQATSTKPELRIDLPEPVPVYITYLTAMPSGSEIASFPDVYGHDKRGLAALPTDRHLAGR